MILLQRWSVNGRHLKGLGIALRSLQVGVDSLKYCRHEEKRKEELEEERGKMDLCIPIAGSVHACRFLHIVKSLQC
jgi:hypothetical protein